MCHSSRGSWVRARLDNVWALPVLVWHDSSTSSMRIHPVGSVNPVHQLLANLPVSGQLGPSHAWNAPLTRWVVLPGPQNNSACQLSLSTPTTGAHIYPLAFWPCLVYLRLRPVPHRSQRWKSRARWNSPLDYAWTIGQTKSSSTRFDSKLCHA